jgi:GxxExxY protein
MARGCRGLNGFPPIKITKIDRIDPLLPCYPCSSILYRVGGKMLHEDITSEIINAFYKVYNVLGYGFLEKVYENALVMELRKRGMKVLQQVSISVYYEGQNVGEYFTDLLVSDKVVIELKAVEGIIKAHENQIVNYLKATDIEVGLILIFGPDPKFKRKIFTNSRKPALKPV